MFKCPPVTHFLGLHQIYDSRGSESWQLWNGGTDEGETMINREWIGLKERGKEAGDGMMMRRERGKVEAKS